MPSIVISGLGLMGSSLAAALNSAGWQVFLHHRRREVSREAARRGWGQAIDHLDEAANADFAIAGVPVNVVPEIVEDLAAACPRALISDVGSTKASIDQRLDHLIKADRFIGSHPMCGSHHSGLDHADPTLYRGARVVITPRATTNPATITAISTLWRTVGAEVMSMPAATHDQAVASASHLPHILASLTARQLDDDALTLAASGFRDTSRVAAGSPALWRSILLANRDAVSALLTRCQHDLADLDAALNTNDEAAIETWLNRGRQQRHAFDQRD
ncbi:MAG: prephenate dehydrogenase [Planctomycetota bacterium]